MYEIIMETVVQIVATLLLTLIGVLGTWLTIKISKKAELANIAAATNEATRAAQTTVLELQQMWTKAVQQAAQLCAVLAKVYGLPAITDSRIAIDWGNGILYDEATQWGEYLQMVEKGLLKPEIALGWRFGMASDTPEEQAMVRSRYMPS